MTRTERSAFPRAIIKDRSESRSGLDKSVRKNGGGPHNWGNLSDERELEYAAMDDEELEFVKEDDTSSSSSEPAEGPARSNSTLTDEEIATAKKLRKNAFKSGDLDLSAIARTSSAVSTSPPNRTTPIASDAITTI
ncbi:hypothetical protein BD779DRAFT_1522920 [Infundibulicybe gibba]|nr:hypothetical protein BD779DRAFT_1522920 [Infundibulicybe gibba]